jgi:ATP-binding cassette subfamily C (CFTR/MRP) protein 1
MAKASGIQLHNTLLRTVMSAPMSFFSKTSTGSITTRFSQDIQLIDGQLPLAVMCVVSNLFICIAQALLIASATFYVALCFPVLIAVFYVIQKYYLRTSRQLRLLDLEEKAPVYTQFIESLGGLTTIRAFAWQAQSIDHNNQLVDHSQRPFYLLFMIQRWLTLVLDLITTALAILVVGVAVKLRGDISAGFAGVSLTQLISFAGYMKLTVLFWTQLETSIGAVSRIKQLTASTEDENFPTRSCEEPPASWPQSGELNITNVSASYDSSLALSHITLSISPGEHIGICGRTGSGKSSLLHVLTGLLPLDSGTITIDGISTDSVPLATLRTRLNAIPQDSLLLPHTTTRRNLDPNSTSPISALEAVLEKVGLTPAIARSGGLDAPLSEDALSHGEKQLFSLARALLRPSKIVLLDEVAGGVDRDTEVKVRDLFKEEFKGRTVVSVVHRLEMIRDFDRVVVMDEGKIMEVGEPGELLSREGGAFKKLWESGEC